MGRSGASSNQPSLVGKEAQRHGGGECRGTRQPGTQQNQRRARADTRQSPADAENEAADDQAGIDGPLQRHPYRLAKQRTAGTRGKRQSRGRDGYRAGHHEQQ
jgi:hypothetical protein